MCDTSSDNDSDMEGTRGATGNIVVPEKSKEAYNKAYTNFMKWKNSKNKQSFNEDVLLAYFIDLSGKFKPSSLWTLYSMLKSTLILNNDVDISKYGRLTAFLKRKTQTCPPVKKSKTFTPQEVNRYLNEAHDNEHLLSKVVMIFGIVGACRRTELYNLQFKDVEVYENKILVKIYHRAKPTFTTKTYRLFSITGSSFDICKKYINLRPADCKITSFFLQYRSGKCRDLPVGINLLGNLCKSIAKFLNLPNPHLYTGHCFRRTSTKILLYEGDQITSKEHSSGLSTTTLSESEGNNSIESPYNIKIEIDNDYSEADEIAWKEHNYGLRTKALPEQEGNSMESSHNSKTNVENRNDTHKTIPEGYSNNLNKIPNNFVDQEFECVNINIPSGTVSDGYRSDSIDNKSHVWKDIQDSVINKNNVVNINGLPNVSEHNPIQDTVQNNANKVVNINLPGLSTNSSIQESVSALVCFNNCRIQNVNVNYNTK